jgi:hypothetical protein
MALAAGREQLQAVGKLTGDTANAVNDIVDHFLANGVVTTSVVVGGILLTTDQLLGVEKVAVFTSSDLIDRRGVKIDEEGSRNILAAAGLGEEGLERAGVTNIGSIGVRSTVGAEAVLEKVAIHNAGQLQLWSNGGDVGRRRKSTYSSQAELPSWTPAWPRWR